MTIVIPRPDLLDQLLRLIGKKRGVEINGETAEPGSAQSYFAPRKENFLKALLRPSGRVLPKGVIDIFMLQWEEESAEQQAPFRCWAPFTMAEAARKDASLDSLRLL